MTHPGAHFELRAQELRIDVAATALGAGLQQLGGRILIDIARRQIDEQILFFDADRERWLCAAHGNSPHLSRWLIVYEGRTQSGSQLRDRQG